VFDLSEEELQERVAKPFALDGPIDIGGAKVPATERERVIVWRSQGESWASTRAAVRMELELARWSIPHGEPGDWRALEMSRLASDVTTKFLRSSPLSPSLKPPNASNAGSTSEEVEIVDGLPANSGLVFISYSHESELHAKRVLDLSQQLRDEGVRSWLDQYESAPPEGWPVWMNARIQEANFVLVICTQTYEHRFSGNATFGAGLGAAWEGAVITNALYEAAAHNIKFLPVVFCAADIPFIPQPLRATTRYDLSEERGYERLYRRLTSQPEIVPSPLGGVRQLPPMEQRRILEPVDVLQSARRNPSTGSDAALPFTFIDSMGSRVEGTVRRLAANSGVRVGMKTVLNPRHSLLVRIAEHDLPPRTDEPRHTITIRRQAMNAWNQHLQVDGP
jgi:hypothetical protein